VPGAAERSVLVPVIAIILGLLVLTGLTIGYTTCAVTASNHR
jgi:hypothetical protein